MLRRKIRPENGYCLFFPNRESGRRFEAGRRVGVWAWEEWKQVRLGLFSVHLDGDADHLITTSEGLECVVRGTFGIVVSGTAEDREQRLERATASCPPTRSPDERIESEFFRDWATNYCVGAVKQTIKQYSFSELLDSPDVRKQVSVEIEERLRGSLDEIGLVLVESTVIVEPSEPSGLLATQAVMERWREYQRVVDEADLATQEAALEKQRRVLALQQTFEIDKMKSEARVHEEEAALEIERKKTNRDKEDELRKIQKSMDEWSLEYQIGRISNEESIDKRKHEAKARLEGLNRAREEEALTADLETLKLRETTEQKRISVAKLTEELSKLEVGRIQREGMADASVAKARSLAEMAGPLKMRDLTLDALPKIIEGASRPIEKIADMRVLAVSGGAGESQENALGGLLASATSLPIMKEVMRFLHELEDPKQELLEPMAGESPD